MQNNRLLPHRKFTSYSKLNLRFNRYSKCDCRAQNRHASWTSIGRILAKKIWRQIWLAELFLLDENSAVNTANGAGLGGLVSGVWLYLLPLSWHIVTMLLLCCENWHFASK